MHLGVAQSGRVPDLDSGGCWFESSHPDHLLQNALHEISRMNWKDCIYPDCQIRTEFGDACEHSCEYENLVKKIRQADLEPPEASFDSAEEMMKWLNGDKD